MDYIIFRKESKDFMRWAGDRRIFLTADYNEIRQELRIEKKDNAEPIIISIKYEVLSEKENDTIMKAILYCSRKRIGEFIYYQSNDDYNSNVFYDELEKWAQHYIKFGNTEFN